MKKILSAEALNQIIKVVACRYESRFQKKITLRKTKELSNKFKKAYSEEGLVYNLSKSGKLNYFFNYKIQFRGDFEEDFLIVDNVFCIENKSHRAKFFSELKKVGLQAKEASKVKRMLIEVDEKDSTLNEHFSKLGKLTSIELIGQVSQSLVIINKIISAEKVKFSRLKKEDVNKLISLDFKSHASDKSSRMNEIFSKPGARKQAQKFYGGMLKNKSMFVAKVGKKLAGNIGFFVDKKNQIGLVACVFVANEFKGMGLSKHLYLKLLNEFKNLGLKYYIGGTTTKGVLALGEKIGRRPISYVYVTKI